VAEEEFSNFSPAGVEVLDPAPRAFGTSVNVADPEALKAWAKKAVQEF